MARDGSQTRDGILLAAERLFADHGFDAVTMRQIASSASVPLASLHYHFGSKAALYRAVWATRYAPAAEARFEGLQGFDFERPREVVLRDLVTLFVEPLLRMRADPKFHAFMGVVAREGAEPREEERGVLAEFLDPAAQRMLAAFRTALPELGEADILWGYQCMGGAVLMLLGDVTRTTRLSGGAVRSGDVDSALPRVIEFALGGWKGLAPAD